jgi:hypothetical protein
MEVTYAKKKIKRKSSRNPGKCSAKSEMKYLKTEIRQEDGKGMDLQTQTAETKQRASA